MNTEQRRRHARDLVAGWPPLTDDQRARLAVLLHADPPAKPAETGKKAA